MTNKGFYKVNGIVLWAKYFFLIVHSEMAVM